MCVYTLHYVPLNTRGRVGCVSWVIVRAGKATHRAREQKYRWSDTIIQPSRVPSKQGATQSFVGTKADVLQGRPLNPHSSNPITKDFRKQLLLSICTKQGEYTIPLGLITWRTSYTRCPMAYHTIPYWSNPLTVS